MLDKFRRKYLTEATDKEEAADAIWDMLEDTPSPPDKDIHDLSAKVGMETDKFESIAYGLLGDFVGYGRAMDDDITASDVDAAELKMGIKIEMEHTKNPKIAKRIALDHLAEFSDYYTRLSKMEKEATDYWSKKEKK